MTEEEEYLYGKLRELRESYELAAQPIIQRLTLMASLRTPKLVRRLKDGVVSDLRIATEDNLPDDYEVN